MTGRLFLLAVTLIAGCKPDPGQAVSADIRVDGADVNNDPDSSNTEMCVAGDGTVYVAWLDDRNDETGSGRTDIWMNRSKELGAAGSWLPAPIQVNHAASNATNHSLYCNESGVYVVWEDDRDGTLNNHQIYFNYSTDQGETFLDTDIRLEDRDADGLSMSIDPQITGYGSNLFVVWADNIFGAPDILVTSSIDGGLSWTPSNRIDSDTPGDAFSGHPRIASSLTGQDVWVVWEDSRDGQTDIYFARSENGGLTFDEDERLDNGDEDGLNDSLNPQICTDNNLHVYVVWEDTRNGEQTDVFMNYSGDKGGTWQGVAVRLDSDAAGFSSSQEVTCVANSSVMHAVWTDKRGEDHARDIYYRQARAGIPGDAEIRLDNAPPEGHSDSVNPRMVLHDGQIAVGWQDNRGEVEIGTDNGFEDLFYNYSTSEDPFLGEDDLRIDSMPLATSDKRDLNIAVLGGSFFSSWTDNRNGTQDIYFTTFAIGKEAKAPTVAE